MREVVVQRDIPASRSAVWAVLADFPNIADWNTGVKLSAATSDATKGVGAKRHCDLAPMGALEETIAEWDPEHRMVVQIDEATKMPFKSATVTFTLDEAEASTPTQITYAYTPRFGPIGSLMGPMVDRQLQKGFTGFLKDLEAAATKS